MRLSAHKRLRPIATGLVCLAIAVAWWVAARSAQPELSLRELARAGSVLMSCADDGGPVGEPLWCADPDSPHCIPALPTAPRADVWHDPIGVLPPLASLPCLRVGDLMAWPKPRTLSLASLKLPQRLDRPPKLA